MPAAAPAPPHPVEGLVWSDHRRLVAADVSLPARCGQPPIAPTRGKPLLAVASEPATAPIGTATGTARNGVPGRRKEV
jgi:hypothetical protein